VVSIGNNRILIACSGGIDSVFLLYYFSKMKKNENFDLYACYVDHKLRPESVTESKFVDKICQDLEISYHFASFKDNFWSDSKKNLEERARKERYQILHDLAIKLECGAIATGHHLDDQVETLMMRMFDRGTGLKGLVGIKDLSLNPSPKGEGLKALPRSYRKGDGGKVSSIKIIRPILHMSRKDIEKEMKGKEYLTDASNDDTDIRRNHFRKNVIPAIEKTLGNDEFKKHIYDLSLNAQRELEFTSEMAREFWEGRSLTDLSLNPSPKGKGIETSPLYSEKRGAGGELAFLPRATIEKHSDNFWLTALSYLFSQHRGFSHSTSALMDILAFIRKKEPANANYDPFIFIRNRDGVEINNSP